MAEPRRRPGRRAWAIGVGALVVAAAAGGITAWATAASGATGYRTATATTATVEQTLTLTGTASPVDQATADFQVAGTVAAVDVAVGQSVTAGQTLASLDTTTLQQAVTSAETNLEAAKATLAEDEAAEAAAATTTTTAPTTTTTTAPNSSSPSSPNGTLQKVQQAVVSAQQAADTAAQQAATALAQAQTACGSAPSSGTTTTTSPTGSGTSTDSTTTGKGSPGSGAPTAGSSTKGSSTAGKSHTTPPAATTTATCRAALQAVLAAQEQVSTDQKAVATAESSLAQILAASGSGSPSGSGATGSGTKSPGATDGGNGSSGNGVPTAAQLASDQASIDKATAALIEAQQDLASAQLTSPLAGTVVSVDLAAGQSVGAGSATDAITVISAGSFEMTASVSSSQAAELKVGDTAEVTVDSTTAPLEGTVARVGPPDTSGSGTSITYPVVVALPAGAHGIRPGSAAQAEVVLRRAEGALVVPTSAVHTAGTGNSYVTVLRTGQADRRPVTVGIVGDIDTQITSGLSRGMTVVLADRSAPLPASSTRTGPGTGGGLNGFSPGGGQVVRSFSPGP